MCLCVCVCLYVCVLCVRLCVCVYVCVCTFFLFILYTSVGPHPAELCVVVQSAVLLRGRRGRERERERGEEGERCEEMCFQTASAFKKKRRHYLLYPNRPHRH